MDSTPPDPTDVADTAEPPCGGSGLETGGPARSRNASGGGETERTGTDVLADEDAVAAKDGEEQQEVVLATVVDDGGGDELPLTGSQEELGRDDQGKVVEEKDELGRAEDECAEDAGRGRSVQMDGCVGLVVPAPVLSGARSHRRTRSLAAWSWVALLVGSPGAAVAEAAPSPEVAPARRPAPVRRCKAVALPRSIPEEAEDASADAGGVAARGGLEGCGGARHS